MVSSHKEYTSKILSAIKLGEDPLAVVNAHREHLAECPRCRENIMRLAKSVMGVDLSFIEDLFSPQPELDLPAPAHMPNPDFTFRGKRIIEVAEAVQFHLKLPSSLLNLNRFRSEQLASVVLSEPAPAQIEQVHQTVLLPGGAGLAVDLQARFLKEGVTELGIHFTENQKGFSAVALRLAGDGEERLTSGALSDRLVFQPLNPGAYELQISILGPEQIPVLVLCVKLILQVSFYLDLKNNRKAASP